MNAPNVYKVFATTVFLMGVALHTTNIVVGPDRFLADVFSPAVEVVFAVMMIVAAVSGWLSVKRLANRGPMRIVFWFGLIMITLSVPIHLRSVVLWSTAWVHAFPKYYSHVPGPGVFRRPAPFPRCFGECVVVDARKVTDPIFDRRSDEPDAVILPGA